MKIKLENNKLQNIFGGYISRREDGNYWVHGVNDFGRRINLNFQEDLDSAIEFEWKNFALQLNSGEWYYAFECIKINNKYQLKRFYENLFKDKQRY